MRRLSRRETLLAALAALWLVVAAVSAALDWPTPRRLAEERLRLAYLAANAVDKDFRPYDQPAANDPEAQYQQLVADFRDRFGERFNIAEAESRHADAVANMDRERVGVVAFAAGSTALLWWLLFTIGRLLGPGARRA
ncbi:conserved hypothetical protein [Solidesulfovibrio fructosivorans JJ]]|uniref:Transmembrane protein n=1 Tax=Solidesulfovibrio fructosivorans JJ] TaxID=596151 RepID=E1JXH5_SOLFR|nr:hypothetical protein [Solidesulfovibrio fructosivorans]EFL50952.1 conserved hypothetical protein [Solidesulfovibrio fructosivorans JJ]]